MPCSKPADFGVVGLGDPQTNKPVNDIPQVLPDPQITVIQIDAAVEDSSANKAGATSAGVEKEIAEEKISIADAGMNL